MNTKQGEAEEKQSKVLNATVTADPVRIQNVPRYTITHISRKNNVKRIHRYPAKQKTHMYAEYHQSVPSRGWTTSPTLYLTHLSSMASPISPQELISNNSK